MELKHRLEELKERIISDEIKTSDIDIINDCIDLITSLEEFKPEEALDESAEAMNPLNGITIYDSDINIILKDDKELSEIIKSKIKEK